MARSSRLGRLRSGLIGAGPDFLSPERRHRLVQAATLHPWPRGRERVERIKASAWPALQTAVAAALAWLVASEVLHHPDGFFAPVAAIIAMGATRGQRARQAVEMMVGVAVGVAVADLLILQIGTGAWQIVVAVLLAFLAALIVGRGELLAIQAAVSAALVATIDPPSGDFPPPRFLDALTGGTIALLFSQLLFPVHPLKLVHEAAESVLGELASTLEDVAGALEARDLEAAEGALERAREASEPWGYFEEALEESSDTARYAPPRRRQRPHIESYEEAGFPIDLTIRSVRTIARGGVRALTIDDPVPDEVPAAVRLLAEAIRGLAGSLTDEAEREETTTAALEATRRATGVLPHPDEISSTLIVAGIQATTVDLLRSTGVERVEAQEMVGAAVTGGERSDAG